MTNIKSQHNKSKHFKSQDNHSHTQFASILLNWYNQNARDLPWRKRLPNLPNPYVVLISEIMLQQTQVSRVKIKLKEFLSLFPTLQELANAKTADLIHAWQGMGYNRRVLNLQKFAQKITTNPKYLDKKTNNPQIPSDPEILKTLPGIGPYCAGSIASFAFNKEAPAIDVNVRRVYNRIFHGQDIHKAQKSKEEKELYNLVKSTIPKNKSADFHNALMDFASSVCTKSLSFKTSANNNCQSCPLNSICSFFPMLQIEGKAALKQTIKRQEKGRKELGKHIPNRIYRGRIVEFIRKHTQSSNNKNQETTHAFNSFASQIKKDYNQSTLAHRQNQNNQETSEKEWLISLLSKLQKENLINYKINNNKISLKLPE